MLYFKMIAILKAKSHFKVFTIDEKKFLNKLKELNASCSQIQNWSEN